MGDHALSRVYNPVGLDIGAESPEEVALAILTIEDYETIGSSGDSAVRSPDLP